MMSKRQLEYVPRRTYTRGTKFPEPQLNSMKSVEAALCGDRLAAMAAQIRIARHPKLSKQRASAGFDPLAEARRLLDMPRRQFDADTVLNTLETLAAYGVREAA